MGQTISLSRLRCVQDQLPVYQADRAGSPQRYASSAASALGYPGTKAYVRSLAGSSFGRAIHVGFVGSYCQ